MSGLVNDMVSEMVSDVVSDLVNDMVSKLVRDMVSDMVRDIVNDIVSEMVNEMVSNMVRDMVGVGNNRKKPPVTSRIKCVPKALRAVWGPLHITRRIGSQRNLPDPTIEQKKTNC